MTHIALKNYRFTPMKTVKYMSSKSRFIKTVESAYLDQPNTPFVILAPKSAPQLIQKTELNLSPELFKSTDKFRQQRIITQQSPEITVSPEFKLFGSHSTKQFHKQLTTPIFRKERFKKLMTEYLPFKRINDSEKHYSQVRKQQKWGQKSANKVIPSLDNMILFEIPDIDFD